MDSVFNEASLDHIAADADAARNRMRLFIDTLRALRRLGVAGPVRTVKGIQSRELSPEYRIGAWLKDGEVPRDEQEFFRIILGSAPYVPELLRDAEEQSSTLYEYYLDNRQVLGLGLADLLDAPAVSLIGDEAFEIDPVVVNRRVVGDSVGEDGWEEGPVEVCNVSNPPQVANRATWIAARLVVGIRTGKELWSERETAFPHLIFCGNTERQLRALRGTELFFQHIVRHLQVLEATTLGWSGGEFLPAGIGATAESDETLRHRVHGPKRVFQTPEGPTTFSWHSKLMGANQRIYYQHSPQLGKTYVAYIGPHLSTVRYPDLA